MNKLDNSGVFTDPAYRIAKSMYVAVGGDPEAVFGSADEIYAAINDIYDSTGSRINVEGLRLQIAENGSYNFDDVEVTGYKPVEIVVDVYQKYTDEQVDQIRQKSYQEGNDDGYIDGYAEGLEDGAEDQKALLETITISENGTYTKEDGYNKVIVDIDVPTGGGTGFDFSVIGYDSELSKYCNDKIEENIAYSKTLYDVWDPSKASAYNLYSGNKQLAYAPYIDTSNVTDMSYMFNKCELLIAIPQLDTSKVTNMSSMFHTCKVLTAIPQLDTSKVISMQYMFYGCSALTAIPQLDTSNVNNMNNMFKGCSALTAIPQLDTSKVTNMSDMFSSCSTLTAIPQLDTSKVINMQYMFYGCSALTAIPQLDTSNVANMSYMFYGCSELTDLGGFVNLGMQSSLSGTNNNYFLYACSKLTHDSLMNLINNLYDRASAGYSVLTLKLHANHHALLTDEEKAIATNKGWTLS